MSQLKCCCWEETALRLDVTRGEEGMRKRRTAAEQKK